ncbi:MAG: histidine phosphatase family protein [Casimicrobiaceae bacterium]
MLPRDAPRRRIVLMRHGDVTYFDEAGRPFVAETVPLSARGRAEADAAGALLASAGLRFDRIITSGLPRTVETAERVLAACPAAGTAPRIEQWPTWQEIQGGRLADIPRAEIERAFLGAFDPTVPVHARRFLGGETVGAFIERVEQGLTALLADPGWDCVLLVLHGGVNRVLLSRLLFGEARLDDTFAQDTGAITMIDVGWAGAANVLRLLNYAALDPMQTATRRTTLESLFEQYRRGLHQAETVRRREGGGA